METKRLLPSSSSSSLVHHHVLNDDIASSSYGACCNKIPEKDNSTEGTTHQSESSLSDEDNDSALFHNGQNQESSPKEDPHAKRVVFVCRSSDDYSDDDELSREEGPLLLQSEKYDDEEACYYYPSKDNTKEEQQHFSSFQHSELTQSLTKSVTTVLEGDSERVSLEEDKQNCCVSGCGRGISFPGWKAYNKNLDDHPVFTKACTSLCGWFLGDFITQLVITPGPFDIHRSITLASFGFFFHGPVGHVVYNNLDAIIVGNGPREIMAKIFVDQVLWCPIFMFCYFTYLGVASGAGVAEIFAKIQSDIGIAILGSWKLWPLAHAFQFRYISTKHRIVYINCIEVCFIMFLSFLGNQ